MRPTPPTPGVGRYLSTIQAFTQDNRHLREKSKINDNVNDDDNFDPGNDFLISSKDVASVYFILHIIEHGIVAVGDDGLGLWLEGSEVVDYPTAEEGRTIL